MWNTEKANNDTTNLANLAPFTTLGPGHENPHWTLGPRLMIPQGLWNAQRKSRSCLRSFMGIYSSNEHLLNVYSAICVPGDGKMSMTQSLPSQGSELS